MNLEELALLSFFVMAGPPASAAFFSCVGGGALGGTVDALPFTVAEFWSSADDTPDEPSVTVTVTLALGTGGAEGFSELFPVAAEGAGSAFTRGFPFFPAFFSGWF